MTIEFFHLNVHFCFADGTEFSVGGTERWFSARVGNFLSCVLGLIELSVSHRALLSGGFGNVFAESLCYNSVDKHFLGSSYNVSNRCFSVEGYRDAKSPPLSLRGWEIVFSIKVLIIDSLKEGDASKP